MTPLIEINNLIVKRDQRTVLEIDHLELNRGETLAVIGPNGAGKTTLFLALSRLIKIHQGEIRFDHEDMHQIDDLAYRRKIALVLQEPLLMDLSVAENIALGLTFRGIDSAAIKVRVTEWSSRLGIDHLLQRKSTDLSGGEAQRVSLGRAFVLHPDLLLLDEPFSALDAPTRSRLIDELKSILRETRTTTVFVTHDLSEAAKLATQVAVLHESKLVQAGKPQDVFANPATDAVRSFFGM